MDRYYPRQMEATFLRETAYYPVLLVTGPRQVGKSTMLLHLKEEERTYLTLDDPATRNLAKTNPELFLARYQAPLLIDEIQYAPELFPYLKMYVDKAQQNNLFWLTGSQLFPLMQGVQESLAGRVRIFHLSGFSRKEAQGLAQPVFPRALETMLQEKSEPLDWPEVLRKGSLPRVLFQEGIDVQGYYQSYVETYLARDVREITNVMDTNLFLRFMMLLALRTAQELNLSDLGRDLGLDNSTIKRWLNILIMTGLVIELPPYQHNLGKRLIKRPKIHFTDSGLASYLCGIRQQDSFTVGPLAGSLFESWVVSEIVKSYQHNGQEAHLSYFRDSNMREIDLLIEAPHALYPCEIRLSPAPAHASKNFSVLASEADKIPFYSILSPTGQMNPQGKDLWILPADLI